eukprot:UN22201
MEDTDWCIARLSEYDINKLTCSVKAKYENTTTTCEAYCDTVPASIGCYQGWSTGGAALPCARNFTYPDCKYEFDRDHNVCACQFDIATTTTADPVLLQDGNSDDEASPFWVVIFFGMIILVCIMCCIVGIFVYYIRYLNSEKK